MASHDRSAGGVRADPAGPLVTRTERMRPDVDGSLTLTDATVAVAVYLKAVRSRRGTPPEGGRTPVPRSLEDQFVQAAAVFGKAHRIEFGTWREFGVDQAVLRRAGIGRRHRRR